MPLRMPIAIVALLASASISTSADRLADLNALAEQLPAQHADFFHALEKTAWDAAVQDLRDRVGAMPGERAVFELGALCALAGDAHTGVDFQSAGEPLVALPLGFEAFGDGVFVVLAGPLESAFLAHRVVAVEGVPIDDVIRRLGRLFATDNEGALRRRAVQHLGMRGALWAAGVITDAKPALELTLKPQDSDWEIKRSVRFADAAGLKIIPWQRAPDFAQFPPPMYLRRATGLYQSDYHEPSGTLYVAYNSCKDAADLPMDRFTQQVLEFWDRLSPKRLLIDLRHNPGGDETVLTPLIDAIDQHEQIDRPGRLFVAIGPRTFSSAVSNAVTLNERTSAVLVGEPTGGSPNHFGEVRSFDLPSGLRVFYSTKRFDRVEGDPDALSPELAAPRMSEHWFTGADPVLDAVLSYEPPATP